MIEQELITRVGEAIDKDEVFAYYQPQYNNKTKKIVGAEALMRLEDSECKIQSPASFIPIMEKSGLIYRADIKMFEIVCKLLREQLDSNSPVVPISVNSSRVDMYDHDYINDIETIRKDYKIPVDLLRIEITETSAGDYSTITEFLNDLHNHGYLVEMDDFGSGYSSLSMLKDIPVDIIKLDMNFFRDELGEDMSERGQIIVNSVIQMTKSLNTPVVAEGVETTKQAEFVRDNGCHCVQGYYYSPPVTEGEFKEKLGTDKSIILK